MSSLDAAVAALAVPRYGAFTVAEARGFGASYTTIARRCTSGTWLRGPGPVLQLPGFPPQYRQRLWWALLVAGPGAMVSHWAAGALHRLTGFPPTRLTITVPHGRYHENPVAQVFQSRAPAVPVLVGGLPVTPVVRTLFDVARLVGPKRLGAAVDDADGDDKTSMAALQKAFLELARPGRNGISTMRTVLDARAEDAYVPPRATLERHLDRVLDRLPVTFEKEAPLPGREWSNERVDRLCRTPPLVVEGDGRRWHTRQRDLIRDGRRRRDAFAAGFPTVNYFYEELRSEPDSVHAELRAMLGLES